MKLMAGWPSVTVRMSRDVVEPKGPVITTEYSPGGMLKGTITVVVVRS